MTESAGDVVEKCINIFVKAGLEIHNGPRQDKVHDSFPILCRSLDQPDMHIRSKAKFTCRCCAASVEADAGRCYRCGVVYPFSELRAVALSPAAIPFYAVTVLVLIRLWFL